MIPLAIRTPRQKRRRTAAGAGRPPARARRADAQRAEQLPSAASRSGRYLLSIAGFPRPVKLSFPIEPDDLGFLAASDSDPFNRWQAVQTLAMSLLTTNVAALRQGAAVREDEGLMAALGAILADKKLEPAFIALAPQAAERGRHRHEEIGRDVDPDAIFAARRKLRTAAGERLGAALEDAYVRLNTPLPYRPDAEDAGRRALKNVCSRFPGRDAGQRSHRARTIPIRSRAGQHDRPHGGAADAFAARPA